jgi:hypothetical protein
MNYIKSIFAETSFSNIWDGQKYISPELLKVTPRNIQPPVRYGGGSVMVWGVSLMTASCI